MVGVAATRECWFMSSDWLFVPVEPELVQLVSWEPQLWSDTVYTLEFTVNVTHNVGIVY